MGDNTRKALRLFRHEKELRQEDMAQLLNVKRETYAAVERGIRNGTYALWERLQKVFAIPDSKMWGLMKKGGGADASGQARYDNEIRGG